MRDFQKRFWVARSTWRRKLASLVRLVRQHEQQRTRALRQIKAATELRQIADGIALCIGWQDERKGYIFRYLSALDTFIDEFSKRAQVPRRYFDVAHWREVRTKLSLTEKNKLKARISRPFFAQMDDRGLRVVTGSRAKLFYDKNWKGVTANKSSSLHGVVAFGNGLRIDGVAQVVRDHRDLGRFPAGRILVSAMTAPEYIVAMRKARAIVTDVGGLTSHAAIVSRELKLPCIVGTKHATYIIKNGDRLSVNTKTGIVEKLKN